MALHLLNGEQNEHVTVHEVSGFISDDIKGALNEAYALSKATKCKQFMYSLSLNPPEDAKVPVDEFEKTLERVEKKLGLENQPRVVVFHEKEGRRHAHCVWSRIDTDEMKAINISHDKLKLNTIAKSLYLEYGWQLPDGFKDHSFKNPLNFTREEWQQAARTNRDPKMIRAALQESWAISSCKTSFEYHLSERGYYLAQGDRRGFIAIDVYGEIHSLTRKISAVKKKDLEEKLGKAEELPSITQVKDNITNRLSEVFKNYLTEQDKEYQKDISPLLKIKRDMTKQHRIDRAAQNSYQEKRWTEEKLKRSARIRSGFKGLFDKINGRYWKNRKRNEQESWQKHLRDRKEREELINRQLAQRQGLQLHLNQVRAKQEQERNDLIRDLSLMTKNDDLKAKHAPDFTNLKEQCPPPSQSHDKGIDGNNQSPDPPDFEPDY